MNADKPCGLDVDSGYVKMAVEVSAMPADTTRGPLILALRGGETSVNDLAEAVGKTQSAASPRRHHAQPENGAKVAGVAR